MTAPTRPSRSIGSLIIFGTTHSLLLTIVHLTVSWLWVWYYQPNEFAGLGLVVALYALPIILLISIPIYCYIHYKSISQHQSAIVVSLCIIAAYNTVLLMAGF